MAVSAVTLLVLAVVLEIVARVFLAREMTSFKPVYTVDEVAGYRFKPNVSEYAFGAQLDSNSHGRRGREWSRRRAPGIFRIALIGDSIAFGFGVPFRDTVGEVLARLVQERSGVACEVLNFGVPGYNARQERAVLEGQAMGFGPDLVLVLLCSNDHDPELWVDDEGHLHWGRPGTADSRVESEQTPRQDRWGMWRHSALLTYVKFVWSRYQAGKMASATSTEPTGWMAGFKPGPVPRHLDAAVLQPLRDMAKLCKEHGVPLVVSSYAEQLEYRRTVQAFAAESGYPTLELLTLFPEVTSHEDLCRKFSLGWDSHPNAEAHARWARGVVDLLAARGLLPTK